MKNDYPKMSSLGIRDINDEVYTNTIDPYMNHMKCDQPIIGLYASTDRGRSITAILDIKNKIKLVLISSVTLFLIIYILTVHTLYQQNQSEESNDIDIALPNAAEQEVEQTPAIGNGIPTGKNSVTEDPISNEIISTNRSSVLDLGGEQSKSTEVNTICQSSQELQLERERIELDLEKIRIQSLLAPSSRVTESKIQDIEIFVTSITKNDLYNSKGFRIKDPVLILMQDRANVHRFGNPDGDDVDQFFKLANNRAKIRSYLERGSLPQDVKDSILIGNGVSFKIKVYNNNKGKFCVDVARNHGMNNIIHANSPAQEKVAFIDGESNFRFAPSVNSVIKFQPRKGTKGVVLERRDKWLKIELENADTGWVHESNLYIIVEKGESLNN